ncbi:3D domain-containing protein [Thermosyntropha sp.]|uniref:3D domain-containing protein n=1 Tax=Thermosyntropha sp. TaxID=2740820 RepID=UPI0025CBEC50|nr:3D domain-containing protein [Thermosyntropha sp.]MBO8159969.1 G5 domain-containing protein [Thermosyntropha sp.]
MGIVWSKKSTYLAVAVLGTVLLMVSLFFALQKPVTVEVDGKVVKARVLFTGTVKDVLEKKGIALEEKDKVEPDLNTVVTKNMKIVVTRAFKVFVTADGERKEVITTPVTVKKAVELAGVKLGEKDIVKTIPTQYTVPGQEIEVIRVTEKEVEVQEPIPFKVERTFDNTLEKGLTRTVSPGKKGLALNTVRITYHNGQEVKREVIKSKVLVPPQNKVIALGNITSVSRGSLRLDFREARYMKASAYTYTGNRTATGKVPEVGMVAVDPSVIPLGTRLYIEGYGYAVAADTGGAIKGNTLDIFMETREQCLKWGRRTVKVYILN